MPQKRNKSCGAVIYRDCDGHREFLLIKGINKHWGFPKGIQNWKESDVENAKREIKEETDLDVDFIDGFEERYQYDLDLKFLGFGIPIKKEVILFLSKVSKEQVVTHQKDEVLEFGWFKYDKALDTLDFEERKRILKSAEDFIARNNL